MKRQLILACSVMLSSYALIAQNVGIGTNNPIFKLDVRQGSINTDSLYRIGTHVMLSAKGTGNTYTGIGAGFANTGGTHNTAHGHEALRANYTGVQNTAIGYRALRYNLGSMNTAIGWEALLVNTTGEENTAVGYATLSANTTGKFNTAVGNLTLISNTTGENNTSIGHGSLYQNTTGINNIALGSNALTSNTVGHNNVALGFNTLVVNTTGIQNSAVGTGALSSNTTGSYNAAFGFNALQHNSQSNNTAVGAYAMSQNTTGAENTAIGNFASYWDISTSGNTAVGSWALWGAQSIWGHNTAVGANAMRSNTNSDWSTAIGYDAGNRDRFSEPGNANTFVGASTSGANAVYNSTAIGYQAHVSSNNSVRIGNSDIVRIGGVVSWSTTSDGRFKKNIKEDVSGLDFIMRLRPVTYNLDLSPLKARWSASRMEYGGKSDLVKGASENKSSEEPMVVSGFIAQEVELAAKAAGYNFSGIDKPRNADDTYGLRYSEFVVPLVKAMQEQQVIIKQLEKAVKDLNEKIRLLMKNE